MNKYFYVLLTVSTLISSGYAASEDPSEETWREGVRQLSAEERKAIKDAIIQGCESETEEDSEPSPSLSPEGTGEGEEKSDTLLPSAQRS